MKKLLFKQLHLNKYKFLFGLLFGCLLTSTIYVFLRFFLWTSPFQIWEIVLIFAFWHFTAAIFVVVFYWEYRGFYAIPSGMNLQKIEKILTAHQTIVIIFDPVHLYVIWSNSDQFFRDFFRTKHFYKMLLTDLLPSDIINKISNKQPFDKLWLQLKNKSLKGKKEQFLISCVSENMLILCPNQKIATLEKFFFDEKKVFLLLEPDTGDFIFDPSNIFESKNPQIFAVIDEFLDNHFNQYHSWVVRAQKGFVILLSWSTLQKLKKQKFAFIEELKNKLHKEFNLDLTFSGGVWEGHNKIFANHEQKTFHDFSAHYAYQKSFAALKMANARSGDQIIVIKANDAFSVFGKQTEKTTAITDLKTVYQRFWQKIMKYNFIFVVGHKNADLDVLGGGLGLKFLLKQKFPKKNVHFIAHNVDSNTKDLVIKMIGQNFYDDEVYSDFNFWREKKYKEQKIALIVLDTNQKRMVDLPMQRWKNISAVCIIDHHIDTFSIKKPFFKFINNKFSSVSEIIVNFYSLWEDEDLKNVKQTPKISKLFDLLAAGMLIDTNNLQSNIKKQTIKWINFLIQKGVNLKVLRQNIDSYKEHFLAQKIESIFVYKRQIILKVFNSFVKPELAASIADDYLLKNIVDVVVVVLFDAAQNIFISARSKIKEFNVEVVCKLFGGGGDNKRAAAKLQNGNVDEIIAKIQKFMQNLHNKA